MSYTVALLDACVMYKQGLRDLLVRLSIERMFAVRWSRDIHREWTRNLAHNNPDKPAMAIGELEARCCMLNHAMPGSLITGYESLIETLNLPDPDDRHVLAAAIVGKADVIVTEDLAGFPPDTLDPYGVVAQSPEDFMIDLFYQDPETFCRAFKKQRESRKNPPRTVGERLAWLKGNSPRLAAILVDSCDRL